MISLNQTKSVFVALLFLLVLSSCEDNRNANTSVDGMFMLNPQHTSRYESPSVKNQPKLLWKVKTGGQVASSPVVVGNVVYIGSDDGNLYAIDAVSGAVKWNFETRGPIRSTPLITQGNVLFLSYDGFFYAINQSDGDLVWKFQTGGESVFKVKDYFTGEFQPDFWDFYLSSAVADNNNVYFGSSDAHIYALSIETGKEIWSYKTEGSVHSSPALSENSLVVGSWDSRVYCLDTETGKENWLYTTGRDTAQYIWLGIQASPSIDEGVVYIGSRDAKLYALEFETGDTIWTRNEFKRSWMPSSAAVGDSAIYTGSSDAFSLYSINKKTGEINYAASTKAYTFSTPAIDDEMAYVGSTNGRLYGIELASGEMKWEFQTPGSRADTIGFFDDKGELNIERARELSKGISDMPTLTKLYKNIFSQSGSVLSSPAIADRVIYFGSCDGYVYAITDKN